MNDTNVHAMPGVRAPTSKPNQVLIDVLRDVLAMAEDGRLQSLIGAGFTADGLRFSMWADTHGDTYQMLGSLAWLQAEYVHKHTPRSGL